MNKKLLTKLVVLAIVVSIILGAYTILSPNYDNSILDNAKTFTESTDFPDLTLNPFLNTSRYFDVVETEEKGYTAFKVNVNGTIMKIHANDSTDEKVVPSQIADLSVSENAIVASSQKKVLKYINMSKILRNKVEIKKFIKNLQIKEAIFVNDKEDNSAMFYDEKGHEAIFINKNAADCICEWMIVHEYVHAISYYTHGCFIGEYGYNKFTEILTDIITSSLEPQITEGIQSAYTDYFYLIYPYINLFNVQAIDSFFYGYQNIYNLIPKEEFDFFVIVIENYGMENSEAYYNNLMYKFYSYASNKNQTAKRKKDVTASFSYFYYYTTICKINPDTTPTKYIIPTILKFSFKCLLLLLNKTKSPTPAPVSKPEIKDAILITFSI